MCPESIGGDKGGGELACVPDPQHRLRGEGEPLNHHVSVKHEKENQRNYLQIELF